jgi:hypothetical protein
MNNGVSGTVTFDFGEFHRFAKREAERLLLTVPGHESVPFAKAVWA